MSLNKREISKLLQNRTIILEKHLARINIEDSSQPNSPLDYTVEYYTQNGSQVGFVLYANDTVIAMRSDNANVFNAVVQAFKDLHHYMTLRHPSFMDNGGWSYILNGLNQW